MSDFCQNTMALKSAITLTRQKTNKHTNKHMHKSHATHGAYSPSNWCMFREGSRKAVDLQLDIVLRRNRYAHWSMQASSRWTSIILECSRPFEHEPQEDKTCCELMKQSEKAIGFCLQCIVEYMNSK
jgi:hypothetical protein